MQRLSSVALGLLAVAVLALPLAAQEDRSLDVSVFGSGNTPLQDLNASPNLGFKSGFGGGLGLTYVLEKNFGVRADVNYVKSNVNIANPNQVIVGPNTGGALNSTSWSHIIVGGDFVLRFPLKGGTTPYFTTGAGMVRFMESGGRKATRMAGRFGAGLKFGLGEKLGAFAQANANVYDFDQRFFEYFTKVQVDVLFSAGLSFRVF